MGHRSISGSKSWDSTPVVMHVRYFQEIISNLISWLQSQAPMPFSIGLLSCLEASFVLW